MDLLIQKVADRMGEKRDAGHQEGLMAVIKVPKDTPPLQIGTSLESEEWLKIVYLKKKGYSHEEALTIVEKLASGEIQDITAIPNK